jgi:hypothetical protein
VAKTKKKSGNPGNMGGGPRGGDLVPGPSDIGAWTKPLRGSLPPVLRAPWLKGLLAADRVCM